MLLPVLDDPAALAASAGELVPALLQPMTKESNPPPTAAFTLRTMRLTSSRIVD
jgi:hypothetical protein